MDDITLGKIKDFCRKNDCKISALLRKGALKIIYENEK